MSRIEFKSEGVSYTLEFDRRSCEIAERSLGLSLSDVMAGKLTMFPLLFQAALVKHHPNMKGGVAQGFFDTMENKQGLYEALAEMYMECVSTLVEDPEEGKGLSWKRV